MLSENGGEAGRFNGGRAVLKIHCALTRFYESAPVEDYAPFSCAALYSLTNLATAAWGAMRERFPAPMVSPTDGGARLTWRGNERTVLLDVAGDGSARLHYLEAGEWKALKATRLQLVKRLWWWLEKEG